MADQLAPVYWRALDSDGNPVASAEATWFESGTSTPLTVYTDEGLGTPHANPQVADSSGVFDQVFIAAGTAAKVVVKRPSAGATLYTIDPVPLTSTGGTAASNITFSAVTGLADTDVQAAIETLNTRTLTTSNSGYIYTAGGSSGAYTVTATTTITAYAAGQEFEFRANHSITGASTLNVDGVGATAIKKLDTSNAKQDTASGDINTGDVVRVKYDGTHWILVNRQRQAGVTADEFIQSQDLSAAAACELTGFDSTKFDAYRIVISNLVPATDAGNLFAELSTDGGSTYVSGGTDYDNFYVQTTMSGGATPTVEDSGTDNAVRMILANGVGSDANEDGVSLIVFIKGPHLSKKTRVSWSGSFDNADGGAYDVRGSAQSTASAAHNAIQFFFSSGNIESGTITMYGLRNS